MAKLHIKRLKCYVCVRQILNLAAWLAMMILTIPQLSDYSHLWKGGTAAVGFAAFAAVLARWNRIWFTMGVQQTDGSKEQNKQKNVRSHGSLKFYYFPMAVMFASIMTVQDPSSKYDYAQLADLGSITAYILGALIIVIQLIIVMMFCAVINHNVDCLVWSGTLLIIMTIVLILTLLLGIALAIYSLVVINEGGDFDKAGTAMYILIILEIVEILGDGAMNILCLD